MIVALLLGACGDHGSDLARSHQASELDDTIPVRPIWPRPPRPLDPIPLDPIPLDPPPSDPTDPPVLDMGMCVAEPATWSARPTWSQVPRKPDYVAVSNNFNIKDSILLLASVFQTAQKKLKDPLTRLDGQFRGRCECSGTRTPGPACADVPFVVLRQGQMECTAYCAVAGGAAHECGATGVASWSMPTTPGVCKCALPSAPNPTPGVGLRCQELLFFSGVDRAQCQAHCDSPEAQACGSVGMDDWLTAGVYASVPWNPNRIRAALRHIKFVDAFMNFVSSSGFGQFLHGLGAVSEKLENWAQIIQKVYDFVDQFTEGVHIGAYSDQRPALIECIGYGGSGVYAEMASLLGGKASIGARYTSHQLSSSERAQLHIGGFALELMGKHFTFMPGAALELQLEGFKGWDASRPFGLFDMTWAGNGVSLGAARSFDIFGLVDDSALAKLDSNGDGWIQPFEFIIKDFYPFTYDATPGGPTQWPRPGVDASWEGRSTAMFGIGIDLPIKTKPWRKQLPGIPLWTGVTLYPYFSLQYGVEWHNQVDKLLAAIRAAINKGLPPSQQVSAAKLGRDMHAMQAPDFSDDQGVTAYVQPEIGADLEVGLNLFKRLRLAVTAHVGLGAKVAPGGFGGIVDLNTHLFEDMGRMSSPPGECRASYKMVPKYRCSSEAHEGGKALACAPEPGTGGSCLVTVKNLGGSEAFDYCIDAQSIAQGDCAQQLEIDRFLKKALSPLAYNWIAFALDRGGWIEGSWSSSQQCKDRAGSPPVLTDPGYVRQSECEQKGVCKYSAEIGSPALDYYDITAARCTEVAGEYRPYSCLYYDEPQVAGWSGPGCSPLDVGFPSAATCQTTDDCVAGESCSGGKCAMHGSGPDAMCHDQGGVPGCVSGRQCHDGACVKTCSNASECADGWVCQVSQCLPPGGVPMAEEIAWGLSHPQGPQHTVSSYALSQVELRAYLAAGIRLELLIKLFGKERRIFRWKWSDTWDLFSTLKSRYQPGLSTSYQDQCTPEDGLVQNHQPDAVTRYPNPVFPAYDTPDELVSWCMAELPGAMTDPETYDNDQLGRDFTNLETFAEAIGMDLWQSYQLCIGGRPFAETLTDPSFIAGASCSYTDPSSGQSLAFPCGDAERHLLSTWGCLDADRTPAAQHLAAWMQTYGWAWALWGGQFAIGSMLIDPWDEIAPDNLAWALRTASWNGWGNLGDYWLADVHECFEGRYNVESLCGCSRDLDCEGGATCQGGACVASDGVPSECPFIIMAPPGGMGPCCGDGTRLASEGCDDGNLTDGDGCSASCQPEGGPVGPVCGDGHCAYPQENPSTCVPDCGSCGNHICEPNRDEDWQKCPQDCGDPCDYDGNCELGEFEFGLCDDCFSHCDYDGICEPQYGEQRSNCPNECWW